MAEDKKAVAYARFSSDNQRDESIDAQLRAIYSFADENDIEILKTYEDRAYSATTDNRPSFLLMMEEAKILPLDYVIVHKSDRFSRNRYDSAVYKKKLKDLGIRLLSVRENFGDGPEAVLMESIIEGFNEYYSKNLSVEVAKGMKENAYKCKYNGGGVPFGYRISKENDYIIHEEEAEAVRLIFSDYVKGFTQKEICDKLNSSGFRTTKGGLFGRNSLPRILTNEKYIGIYRTTINGESIEIEGGIPQILDKDLFYKAQELRASHRFKNSKKAKNDYLLTGFLYHEGCGLMQADSTINRYGKKYTYYYCKQCGERVRTEKLDRSFSKAFLDFIFTKENVEKLIESIYSYFKKVSNLGAIQALSSDIKAVYEQIDNITNSIADLGGNPALYRKLEELTAKKDSLEKRRNQEQLKFRPVDREFIRKIIEEFKNTEKNDTKKLKGLLAFLVSRVEYSENNLKIILKAQESSNSPDVAYDIQHETNLIQIDVPLAS